MIELAGQVARFLHGAAGCGVLGLLAFELIVAADDGRDGSRKARLSAALGLTGVFLVTGIFIFAAQLSAVAGGLGEPAAWLHYAETTRFGTTWLFQQALALLLLGMLAASGRAVAACGRRAYMLAVSIAALLAIPASAFAGHGAADANPGLAVAINGIHIVAVGCWAGGLPALLALSWQTARDPSEAAIFAHQILEGLEPAHLDLAHRHHALVERRGYFAM